MRHFIEFHKFLKMSVEMFDGLSAPVRNSLHASPHSTIAGVADNDHDCNVTGSLSNKFMTVSTVDQSLRDFFVERERYYCYCCLTGIIWPRRDENPDHSTTRHNFRYRLWNGYLHAAFLFFTVAMIFIAVVFRISDTIHIIATFGLSVQNMLLYPAVLYLQTELSKIRIIDKFVYEEAMDYAMHRGRVLQVALQLLLLIYLVLSGFYYSAGQPVWLLLVELTLTYATVVPTCWFLSGVLTVLLLEQRVSLHTMNNVYTKVQNRCLSQVQYTEYRATIDERDKIAPINVLVVAALINTIAAVILLFAISDFARMSTGKRLAIIVYILAIYCRQTIVVLVLLVDVVKVNEIAEQIIDLLSFEWTALDQDKNANKVQQGDLEAGEKQKMVSEKEEQESLNTSATLLLESRRHSLYILTQTKPIGSKIFFVRPTKLQIQAQVVSGLVAIGLAIFWAIVFA